MTQQEFQDRVKMQVSAEEYDAIEVVYMNCDLDKDEFCKMWAKMNKSRIEKYARELKAQREHQAKKKALWAAYELITSKTHKIGYNRLVVDVFTKKQQESFDKLNICYLGNAYMTIGMAQTIAYKLYNMTN